MTDYRFVRTEDAPLLPPPANTRGIMGWLWENIFSSMSNFSSLSAAIRSLAMVLLTVFFGWAIVTAVISIIDFAFISAVWSDPERLKREICNATERPGACWPMISEWFYAHVYGNEYPREYAWRVNVIYALLAFGVIWLVFEKLPFRRYVAIFMLSLFPILTFVFVGGSPLAEGESFTSLISYSTLLIALGLGALWYFGARGYLSTFGEAFAPVLGVLAFLFAVWGIVPIIAGLIDFGFGFGEVPTSKWGGLLITLVVALTGIIVSLPLGILLALGRQSQMPFVKIVSVIFIESIRGIPLISILFFASVMLEHFLSDGVEFDKLLRALIGVALFASAYMAEVIRGGLQAVPKGQYEGAMSLGLNYSQQMRLIILPQALTIVIPGIVNTFIGLFKDTTLVMIISIFDLLGIGQLRTLKDIEWFGPYTPYTEYLFLAAVFWVFCFGMSRYSMNMERKLDRSHR